ncbi:hypothetical protein BpHYR1_018936 [Brachionus plicatilis]|uniref:Uncharacterized protein n=1 Tax=Brachionus plicatilis TaxID=10195 RepID=A0A3M7S7F1_BRAPC|nr:hypothetical protein BpHYR1_018936 [Brachionus plicatilis]
MEQQKIHVAALIIFVIIHQTNKITNYGSSISGTILFLRLDELLIHFIARNEPSRDEVWGVNEKRRLKNPSSGCP